MAPFWRTSPTVTPIIGREAELRQGLALLDDARAHSVARVLRVTGSSGIGKTAVVRALAERAKHAGWLTAIVTAHRVQATLPFVTARKLIGQLVSELAADAARYTSGLDGEIASAVAPGSPNTQAIEDVLLRLLQAVSLDHPLLIVLDDAHWADPESRMLIGRLLQALADRPLVIISIERIEDNAGAAFDFADAALVIGELDKAATASLARTLLPDASDDVIGAIADHARGLAIDVVTLANSASDPAAMTVDDVRATQRAIVARDAALFDPDTREFLQICSLIAEPIEYDVLRELWPDEKTLLSFIERCSGRYLVQQGDGLHFMHAAVCQSVRETLAIEIPYRRRIIEAISRLPNKTLEDIERIVEQARACGDRGLEASTLQTLAERATSANALPLAASALERLLAVARPGEYATMDLYEQLALLYNAIDRPHDAVRVCTQALERLSFDGDGHRGKLVAWLLFALWHVGDRADFERTYKQYDEQLDGPIDRAHLLFFRLFASVADFDETATTQTLSEIEKLGVTTPVFETRRATFEALARARHGDYDDAANALVRAKNAVRTGAPPAMRVMVDSAGALIAFHHFGANDARVDEAFASIHQTDHHAACVTAIDAMSMGRGDEAVEIVSEALVRVEGAFPRRVLLGIGATAAIVTGHTLPAQFLAMLNADADLVLRGNTNVALLALAGSSAYFGASGDAKRARQLVDRAAAWAMERPAPFQLFWMPITLVLAAEKLNDRVLLEQVANGAIKTDLQPWNVAHHGLAVTYAKTVLGVRGTAESTELERSFAQLGAPHFAAMVSTRAKPAAAESAAAGEPKLSRREREVAALVAEGHTNREIAEHFVLSERTIEVHVANIFNKLDVRSRSQVAAWYVRANVGSVPGARA